MEHLQKIYDAVLYGNQIEVVQYINDALANQVTPDIILKDALTSAMTEVGERFKKDEIFVPEVLLAARAMNAAVEVLKPHVEKKGIKPLGKGVICTVFGDMHDVGKNLVKMMIAGTGIEIIDLGVNCPAEDVVKAVRETGAKLVCLSSLLTTTMLEQKNVIDALKLAGLRDQVKIMVGGAPVNERFAKEIGADGYTPDAASAAEKAKSFFVE